MYHKYFKTIVIKINIRIQYMIKAKYNKFS
jgi:hypothetical protein